MATMITPKKDLYFIGEPHLTENLYGKKGRWYTIREYNNGEFIFTSETGKGHIYDEETLNEHYHTIDFEKGFSYNFQGKEHFIKDYKVNGKNTAHIKNCINNIKTGLWKITSYSNGGFTSEELYNPVKTISHDKYYRCRGEYNTTSVQFNSDKGILFMDESLCGKYYYWSDYDCNNNVIYRRGEKSWVEDNYDSVKDSKLASFKVSVENNKATEEDNTQLWDNRELGCDENFLKVLPFDETMEETIKSLTKGSSDKNEWTDKHYDFNYTLTEKDIESGVIKIDPYFVAYQWKLGSKDDSGALWHTFKGIARYGEKNSVEREIRAFHAQIKRLAELNGVKL